VVLVVLGVHISFCLQTKPVDDHSLAYVDGIEVSRQMTGYCLERKLQSENVCAGFLMRSYLSDEYAGYVKKDELFTNTHAAFDNETQYVILTNYEKDESPEIKEQLSNATLLNRFEKNDSWSEIYKINTQKYPPGSGN
jgi:hypothetical protein